MSELETFGPNLTKTGKENPFRVPEGYFDSLPSRVQELCKDQKPVNHSVSLYTALKSQIALAAGILLFILLTIGGFFYTNQSNRTLFGKKDYIKIVEESGTEFDEMQLYEAVSPSNKKDSTKKMSDEYFEYYLYKNYYNGTLLEDPKDIKP